MNPSHRPVRLTRRKVLGSAVAALAAVAETGPSAQAAPPVAAPVNHDDTYGQMTSGVVTGENITEVLPGIWRIHVGGKSEQVTPLSFRSAPANASALGLLPPVKTMPLEHRAISWTLSARGISVQLPMTHEERIYGLGLDTEIFDMTDRRAICCPSDTPQDKMNYSHAPVSFYVSNRGYGVYVDTARYAWFYTGNVVPKADAGELAGTAQPALSTAGLYEPTPLHHKTMLVDVHPSRGLDIYIFAGPTLRHAVQRYNLFSGGGAMPPLWGLGIHYRGESMMSDQEIVALARRLRAEKMPCDMWGLEPGWQSRVYPSSFEWDRARFPDPDAFIKTIKSMNYHLNAWEHAFTSPISPLFKPLRPWSGNFLVWGGLTPDFATAEARKIWMNHHDKIMFSKGIDGVKLDECDNQPYRAHPWSFPEASVFPSGLDGELMHTLFGELYQQTMLQPLTRRNLRTWSLVRDTFALAAPLPFTVYSDSYDFNCYLRGVCKQAFSGVMWVPEVRNAESVEELYRRVQLVIFAPMALINCWYMKLPPWLQINRDRSNQGQLMPEHQQATKVVRTLFELRMRLIPYLYAAFNEYRLRGMPPIRPLVMDWPDDVATHTIDDQFMFGPAILVAPVQPGRRRRRVYLPAGHWYDFATHQRMDGGRWITVDAPVERIPMFVKSGSIIPLAEPVPFITAETCFELTVYAFGTPRESITLYEDDGTSLDYQKGRQNTLEITWRNGTGSVARGGNYSGPPRYAFKAFHSV